MGGIAFDLAKTPNPNARRVGLAEPIFERPATYRKPAEAEGQPLIRDLLGLPGVAQVFAMENFITVTKEASADWEGLERLLRDLLQRHLNG
jgi:hypothetical protein